MASVVAGSRLVLHTDSGRLTLRSLRTVELADFWHIPVLAGIESLEPGHGVVDLPTDEGIVRVDAHLQLADDVLALCPGRDAAPVLLQRRDDVRAAVALELRGTGIDALSRQALAEATLIGTTLSISAGGLAVALTQPAPIAPSGSRVYLELELPGGELVPAVVGLVDMVANRLRGRFIDIAAFDRERLVRLVFAEQRRELAARRRRLDGIALLH